MFRCIITVVLVLVLVVVLALVFISTRSRREPFAVGGNDAGGSWTDAKTWPELFRNPTHRAQYYADLKHLHRNMQNVDHKNARKQLAARLNNPCESYGIINVIDNEMIVSSIHTAATKGELSVWETETISRQPGHILYHTHPTIPGVSPFPSAADIISYASLAIQGRHVYHAVVSSLGIIVYGLVFTNTINAEVAKTVKAHRTAALVYGLYGSEFTDRDWDLRDLIAHYKRNGFSLTVLTNKHSQLHKMKWRTDINAVPTDTFKQLSLMETKNS